MLEEKTKINMLTVIRPIDPPGEIEYAERMGQWYECRCECGNLKNVTEYNLTHNKVKSCGCLKKSRMQAKDRSFVREGLMRNGTCPGRKPKAITIGGKPMTIKEMAAKADITVSAMYGRLRKMAPEEALASVKAQGGRPRKERAR